VSRYLIGQARTYIRCGDTNPGEINIQEAVRSLKQGRVMVGFGLLPEITINKKYGPGELVPSSNEIVVSVRILAPSWLKANRVSLYANGKKIREEIFTKQNSAGIKWKGNWVLPRQKQDFFLVVIAEGDGPHLPFWPIVKPFQPISPAWTPYVIGCSGAIWVDADGDGRPTPAYTYAKKLVDLFGNNLDAILKKLNGYDEAVAVQVAALLQKDGIDLQRPGVTTALQSATAATRAGFNTFIKEWQLSKEKRKDK
jgi:hypothetical protein